MWLSAQWCTACRTVQPSGPDQVYSIDFMHDSLWDRHTCRLLNVIDDNNHEVLAIEVDTSLPALRVIRVLERIRFACPCRV